MAESGEQEQSLGRRALLLVCTILVVAALYVARELLIPFALAAFLCFVLSPIVRTVERLRVGRIVAVFFSVFVTLGVVGVVGWLVASQTADLATQFPRYRQNIISKFQGLQTSVSSIFDSTSGAVQGLVEDISKPIAGKNSSDSTVVTNDESISEESPSIPHEGQQETAAATTNGDTVGEPVKVQVVEPQYHAVSIVGMILGPVVHPLTTAGVTMILVFFLLIYRQDLRDRVVRLCGQANIQVTTSALEDCARRVARYLAAQALANTVIGVLTGLGLYYLGIPNATVWGLISGVLRFIPYVGSFIAALFPVSLAVAIFDGWRTPLLVLGWCVFADMLSAYFLEPWLFGAKTGVSPMAILFSFFFWTWLWGGIGILLATPITVCLVVLGKHIPAFEVFSILLSDEPVLEPRARFYQRLLAMKLDEATKIMQASVEESSFVEACDQILLPALAQLESDRRTGLLDEKRVEFVREAAKSIIETYGPTSEAGTDADSKSTSDSKALIFAAGDRGAFDNLIPSLLARALVADPIHVMQISADSTVAEIVAKVRDEKPVGFVFSAIEPRDSGRMRHICKRLNEWPGPIHIAIFSASRSVFGYRRFSRETTQHLHGTLGELLNGLRQSASSYRSSARADVPSIPSENRTLDVPILDV